MQGKSNNLSHFRSNKSAPSFLDHSIVR